MCKNILILICCIVSLSNYAQTLNGTVTDNNQQALAGANLIIQGTSNGASADAEGWYHLSLLANRSVIIEVSFIGFETEKIRIPMLKKEQIYTLHIQLNPKSKILQDVIIQDKESRKKAFSRIKT